jgi:hypothetical protein
MTVATFEGVVEHGRIYLKNSVQLPEKQTVFVIVPGFSEEKTGYIATPRLVHAEQARDFEMEISEENHAGI